MSFELFLASSSPRRRELLAQIGVQYRIVEIDVPEVPVAGESPEAFALRVAMDKARAGWESLDTDTRKPVLGADTVVVIDDEILGKPRDKEHTLAMLAKLSGRSHEVITAVAIMDGEMRTRVSRSTVRFDEISAAAREAYWQTGEPADKAGAYGIQGLGAMFVEKIDGSYSGIMGLPVVETVALLATTGLTAERILEGHHDS